MASGRTSRLALDFPLTSDAPFVAQDVQTLATQLDTYIDGWQQGLAASRAAAWPEPPAGARYHATDTGADTWYSGSAWLPQIDMADIVAAVLPAVYPIGCLYTSTTNVNPATELGFGSWSAYAAGRVPIGVGTGSDGTSSITVTPGETGGEYLHELVTAETPAIELQINGVATESVPPATFQAVGQGSGGDTNIGGANSPHNNIQPYVGVNIWRRIG